MISPLLQSREKERVRALREYAIANTPAEKSFNDLAKLAKYVCGTSMGFVTFID